MTKPDHRKALTIQPEVAGTEAGYEVGYRKPPAQTRFKPGQSGNPKGRPRGRKNRPPAPAMNEERLKAIILEEAYRPVTVNDAPGPISVPMAQAVIRSLAVNAAKGGQRAQRLFTELLTTTERDNKRLHDEWLDVAMTYKIEWERELARREALGIIGPDPLPHPDHIVIDIRKGTATIRGPATREEKAEWDRWLERRAMFEQERDELREMLESPACENREIVERELADTEKVLVIIARALGGE